jgi:hypothetical protein
MRTGRHRRTDGWTDMLIFMTKLTEAFRNFVNAPNDIDKSSVTGKLYIVGRLVSKYGISICITN